MGKQINFYMEEDTYKQIVEKALVMGYVILYEEKIGGTPGNWEYKYHRYEEMPDFPLVNMHYFYNPALGGLHYVSDDTEYTFEEIKAKKLFLGSMFAPMIETGCSRVSDDGKFITRSRMYIRSDYYNSQGVLIKQSEEFMKQYASLTRIAKKLAVKRELKGLPEYPDWITTEYMTDYMFGLYKKGYDVRG